MLSNFVVRAVVPDMWMHGFLKDKNKTSLCLCTNVKNKSILTLETEISHMFTNVMQIVNWFRVRNVADMKKNAMVEPLTQMKVMKLLYYAQGLTLAAFNEELFEDEIVAWKYGPVVEEVHQVYLGKRDIVPSDLDQGLDNDVVADYVEVSKNDTANIVLNTVMEVYGDKSAIELMNMTHKETPWISTQQSQVIPKNVIKEYFKENILA